MKLYTEEQVRQAFIEGCDFIWDDIQEYTQEVNEIVNKFTPIELPSDEEIHKKATEYSNFYYEFEDGAKWMRDKILNK